MGSFFNAMSAVPEGAPGEDAAGEVVEQRTLLSVAPMLDCTNRHFRCEILIQPPCCAAIYAVLCGGTPMLRRVVLHCAIL